MHNLTPLSPCLFQEGVAELYLFPSPWTPGFGKTLACPPGPLTSHGAMLPGSPGSPAPA